MNAHHTTSGAGNEAVAPNAPRAFKVPDHWLRPNASPPVASTAAPAGVSAAVAFLQQLDASGYHNLVAMDPNEQERLAGKTFKPGDWVGIQAFIDRHKERRNLYFSVNEPRPDAPHEKLSKKDIGRIRAIFVDLDPDKRADVDQEKERERLAQFVIERQGPLAEAAFAIQSGYGVQVLWRIADGELPEQPEKRELVVKSADTISRNAAFAFGGDNVQNVDRLLRLPGTTNFPNLKKQRLGRKTCEASLLWSQEKAITRNQAAGLFPAATMAPKSETTDAQIRAAQDALDWQAVVGLTDYAELPADARQRFEGALAEHAGLDQLWKSGEPHGHDKSRSGARFELARWLKRLGFSVTDYGALLAVWPHAFRDVDQISQREVVRAWARCGVVSAGEVFEVLPEENAVAVAVEPIDLFGHATQVQLRNPPAAAVPEMLARWARSEARRKGAPEAFSLGAGLATIGSAIGTSLRIQVRERDPDFTEPAALWCTLVAEPGSAKSPIISAALKPLKRMDAEWQAADTPRYREWQRAAKQNRKGGPLPDEPRLRRALVDDITVERQIAIHAANPRGIMRSTDELAGLLQSLGAYKRSGGGDRAAMLRLFDGDSVSVDRVSSGNLFARHALMGTLAGTQPDKLRPIVRDLQSDGLLQRFLFILDDGQRVASIDEEPDREAAAWYSRLIQHLLTAEYLFPDPVRMSGDGYRLFGAFKAELGSLMEIPAASTAWQGHLQKWEKIAARIVLIFHAMAEYEVYDSVDPAHAVHESVVQQALDCCRFLLRHSLAFYSDYFTPDPSQAEAQGLAGYLLTRPDLKEIKRREIYQARGSLKGPENQRKLFAAARALEDAGWLALSRRDADGPAAWQVNPAIHVRFAERAQFEREERARQHEAILKAAEARRKLMEDAP